MLASRVVVARLGLLSMLLLAGPVAAADERSAAPRVIVKLRPGIDACLSCAVTGRTRLGGLGVQSALDDLNRRYAGEARPLLRAHARGAVPESAEEGRRRRERLAASFPRRAARQRSAPPDFSGTFVVGIDPDLDPAAVAAAYAADPAVEYAEPDRAVRTQLTTNDPFLSSQGSWGQGFLDLWGIGRIRAPTAWDTVRGAGVVVAVVDTGVDHAHPDLAANLWTHPGEVPANGVDDDGNGFVDDVRGWNFVAGSPNPFDDNGHGTHVAGTIAAVGNNARGVVGVAFESRIMAIRGLDASGAGFVSDLVEAVAYAIDNGADVINASWGGAGPSHTMASAVAAAHAAGVVFVAAAGNSASDVSGFQPAGDRNAITVTAFNHLDQPASFTNFGVAIDVGAPGGGDPPPPADVDLPSASILSLRSSVVADFSSRLFLTQGGDRYVRLAGTSMAAPHVAGTAALILALHPTYSVEQVRQVLRSTADDVVSPGWDEYAGHGLVDAAGAVAAAAPLEARITAPAAGEHVGQVGLAIQGTAQGPGFEAYWLDFRPRDDPDGWMPIAGPLGTPVDGGLLADWPVADAADGSYVLRLRVVRGGESFVDQLAVTLRNVKIDTPEIRAAIRPDGPVEIRGTAAGGGFVSYAVEYRRPAVDPFVWRSDGVTLAGAPGVPVRQGLLATLDASSLTEGDRFDFRLTVVNGSGTHERRRSGIVIDPTLRAGWPKSILGVADAEYLTVADLDGDGTKEILVGSGHEVIVFQHDGSIRPGWPQSVVVDRVLVSTRGSPLVGDVAGDAAPEVIATNREDVLVWDIDGNLLPGFPVPVDAFAVGINDWISLSDLDGDGKDEILCAGVLSTRAFRGDGTEVPQWHQPMDGRPFAVGDVDGDGLNEIGAFVPGESGTSARGTINLFDRHYGLLMSRRARGSIFTHPAMADMDGDGSLDLVVVKEPTWSAYPRVRAYSATGRNVGLKQTRKYGGGFFAGTNGLLSFADLDRDGRAEGYLYGRANNPESPFEDDFGYFMVVRDRGSGVAREPIALHEFWWVDFARHRMGSIAIGDIDGDGVQELVAGASGSGCGRARCDREPDYWVYRAVVAARADGSLHPAFPKPIPVLVIEDGDVSPTIGLSAGVDDARYDTPAIADLDGDGLKEVVWVDGFGARIFVWNVAGTPGPELADWPMYHHDAKHSNVLPLRPNP